MLSCDADETIIWIYPIIAPNLSSVDHSEIFIMATVDDCECECCEVDRSALAHSSAIKLHVANKGKELIQFLTAEEARVLGTALIQYASDITSWEEVENEAQRLLEEERRC